MTVLAFLQMHPNPCWSCPKCTDGDCEAKHEWEKVCKSFSVIDKSSVNKRTQRHKAKMIASGKCIYCGKPLDRDAKSCTACSKRVRESVKLRRERMIANGLCYCGKPLMEGRKYCEDCLKRHREYARKKQEQQKEART